MNPRVASAFYGEFVNLRPIQFQAIEPILSGSNVIISSGTSSGKTEAALVPFLSKYWDELRESPNPIILYVCPTKALVNDLEKRIAPRLARLNLAMAIRHGDRDDFKHNGNQSILITTPESLEVLLLRADTSLDQLKVVIIDEVHLLYNSQRGLQLSIELKRISARIGRTLQWCALSATIGDPDDIRTFLFGKDASYVGIKGTAQREISAHIRSIQSLADLFAVIRKMISGNGSKQLVFTNSRRTCERLATELAADHDLKPYIYTHYSSLSPEMRKETEEKFSLSPKGICFATSTLELGIDIGDIDVIVLWGVPPGLDSFLQRIGRGNRRLNKTNVVCLIPDDSDSAFLDTLRFLGLVVAGKKGEMFSSSPYHIYGAVAQQCLSMIQANEGRYIRTADISAHFAQHEYLNREIIDNILSELSSQEFVSKHGFKNRFGGSDKLYQLHDYSLLYGNFPLTSRQVPVYFHSKHLGDIPQVNLLRLTPGTSIRFGGATWRISKCMKDGIFVDREGSSSKQVEILYGGKWKGFDSALMEHIYHFLMLRNEYLGYLSKDLVKRFAEPIDCLRQACVSGGIPSWKAKDKNVYLTFGGAILNDAITRLIGERSEESSDFAIVTQKTIEWNKLPSDPSKYVDVVSSLGDTSTDRTIYQSMLPKNIQLKELLEPWIKDQSIYRTIQRLRGSSHLTEVDKSVRDLVWKTI